MKNKPFSQDKTEKSVNTVKNVKIAYRGCSKSFFEWLEFYNGVNNMPLELILKICSVFGLRIKGNGDGSVKLVLEIEV